MAAEEGFSAAYCCTPAAEDRAGESVKTLMLLVKTYAPGGKLVDAFYPASNAAYHAAQKLAERLAAEMGAAFARLDHVLLKPICARLPAFAQGINTIDYLPGAGSRFCMELIGTDAEIAAETRAETPALHMQCLSCRRCMAACPTGALSESGFARDKCLRNYMLGGKAIPEGYRGYIGTENGTMGIVGCDICQRVCPFNAKAEKARCDQDAFTLMELLDCAPETLERFAAWYGRNYAIRNRIVAQAVLAAANMRDGSLLERVRALRESPSPIVREHAAWACDKFEELENKY